MSDDFPLQPAAAHPFDDTPGVPGSDGIGAGGSPEIDREALLQSSFAAMSEGLVIHDRSGEIVEANPAALSILGLSREALMGLTSIDPCWQAIRADGTEYPGLEHPAMITLRTGESLRDQIMGIDDPRRGLVWLSINSDPIWRTGEDTPCAVIATFSDVTERRSLHNRLAAATGELRDLYDRAPCAYYSLNASGTFARINATALGWLGCTAEDVIGKKTPADFMDPDHGALFNRRFAELKADGAMFGIEAEWIATTGHRRRISLSATTITDADGRFVMCRTVGHDITELHQVRGLLRSLNVEQQAMLNNDLIGIARTRDRHFVWTNPGMTRIFGHPPDALQGRPTRLLYADEADYQTVGAASAANRAAGMAFRRQVTMQHADGRRVCVDLSSMRLSEETGESLAIFVDLGPPPAAPAVPR